ncbi:MAG: 50S ribosomal protein L16 [Candidatus Kerfeldbacteria bacterium]|nr:50S ribosomal protein L16 [Candidatus Kerfeldbacteria bacterium]
MFIPRKVKHRKRFQPKFRTNATRKISLAFGSYGLKAQTESRISSRQLEAARRAMTRFIKRGGKIWIRIFPDFPITDKGGEVRMGSGKGPVDHYVAEVKPGTILFEMDGVEKEVAEHALRLAASKLPLKAKFISKDV